MIVIMPTTIGGAMIRMWLTMEPRVRSFISTPPERGRRTFARRPRTISLRRRDLAELGRLPLEQRAVDAVRPHGERLVRALLDDLSAIEHQDAVHAAHGRQPVCDHDRGAALHQ